MTTTHASAVLIGARAVLIRGPAGAGKSRLAFALVEAQAQGLLRDGGRGHAEPQAGGKRQE